MFYSHNNGFNLVSKGNIWFKGEQRSHKNWEASQIFWHYFMIFSWFHSFDNDNSESIKSNNKRKWMKISCVWKYFSLTFLLLLLSFLHIWTSSIAKKKFETFLFLLPKNLRWMAYLLRNDMNSIFSHDNISSKNIFQNFYFILESKFEEQKQDFWNGMKRFIQWRKKRSENPVISLTMHRIVS